ncbi:hypothetical protein GC176_21335 [bacterium]|nr:hypothetical protein [bacterium]
MTTAAVSLPLSSDVIRNCQSILLSAKSVAQRLEQGQVTMPLTSHFQRLLDSSSTVAEQSGSTAGQSLGVSLPEQVEMDISLLDDVIDQKLRYQLRRRLLLNPAGLSPEDASVQRRCVELKDQLDERLSSIQARLSDRIRERARPASAVMNRIRNLMEDLSPGDISEEHAYRVTRLTVSPEFLKRAESLLEDAIAIDLREDAGFLNAAEREAMTEVSKLLNDTECLGSSALPDFDSTTELARLCDLVHLNSRYHGELPRRTWMDRISSGRRPVFVIMMTASLAGSALGIKGGLVGWLLPVMFVLFIIGTVWTFRSFRDERDARIERELIRLRDTLGAELKRLYESLQKEWLDRLNARNRLLQSAIRNQLDGCLQRTQDQSRRDFELMASEMNERRQSADRQIRELESLRQTVVGLKRQLS